ncbi:MAG TPA: hypothetical protein VER96_36345 [Polyangiaceae bacterium]|nr:hypothetical protein [Polyangiaceae bacterium]
MNARTRAIALSLCALSFASSTVAQSPDAGAPAASGASAAPTAAGSSSASAPAVVDSKNAESCVERIPSGKDRPHFTEKVARRALSGHALTLEVVVDHGKGETVLPTGFHLLSDSAEGKALEREGFALPDPGGSAGPKLERTEQGERATTKVKLSVVPLPPKPGRHELVLPPLPIAISRASGEIVTVCTTAHTVLIEDPIANTPNPAPKGNPAARRQLEIWTAAKTVAIAVAIALVIGALGALLISRWLRRPKKLPPPPPPRPPWDVALEALHDIRHAGLTREGRFAEVFDRVSDVLRRYLGDRYGYDGLESTTREALVSLRETTPQIEDLPGIETFMRDADLVKFARLTPSEGECLDLLARAESIVTRTMLIAPLPAPPQPESAEGENDAETDEPSEPKNPGGGS